MGFHCHFGETKAVEPFFSVRRIFGQKLAHVAGFTPFLPPHFNSESRNPPSFFVIFPAKRGILTRWVRGAFFRNNVIHLCLLAWGQGSFTRVFWDKSFTHSSPSLVSLVMVFTLTSVGRIHEQFGKSNFKKVTLLDQNEFKM
jgi:hypothetical protein